MKGSALVFSTLALFYIVAFVQCSDPLTEHIMARRQKRSVNVETENSGKTGDSYSPVLVGQQFGLKEADQITVLPGQPSGIGFNHYSGYVTVDPTAGRALFYYFAESENSSSSKPLVLWLNGGPGCSSIGAGAMIELGPFRVNADGKTLWYNPYAWNTAANVLFLESPAGVGFSYSNTTSDYVTGDTKTAADSYAFLVNWLERYPEYKTREFFITGESYAGHYIPQLAQLILKNNKITNQTVINLKGIAMGNAYIDKETMGKGNYDYVWSHALISDEIHDGIFSNCNFSSSDPESKACLDFRQQATEAKGHIDPYNIYAPLCFDHPSDPPKIPIPASEFDPCSSDYVFSYLNTPEVQKSLHANTTGLPGPWRNCNGFINRNWQDEPDSVLPLIKELSASGISLWIYSGDTDSVVSVTTTRYAITKMGFVVKTPWYPWINNGEVGGYVVGYENLTFVTVRGTGHFVPSYQPARTLAMFSSFLEGKLPPSSKIEQ